jgi:transcriptional regulator with PAS, ATPase and Fis domain
LEAELFGVAPGAATGVAPRAGKLEAANGGTVLLDEIGEMRSDLQIKLLRVLEQQSVEPLGGSPRRLDIRVVASTNRTLRHDTSTGRFRSDLYFRLAGFILEVPPLRHRKSDIPSLVEHFFVTGCSKTGKQIKGVSYAALKAFTTQDWPGNVRQLRHAVFRAVHATPAAEVIDSERIRQIQMITPRADSATELNFKDIRRLQLDELECAAVREALRRSENNQAAAAHELGISRSALRRRMIKHGLQRDP